MMNITPEIEIKVRSYYQELCALKKRIKYIEEHTDAGLQPQIEALRERMDALEHRMSELDVIREEFPEIKEEFAALTNHVDELENDITNVEIVANRADTNADKANADIVDINAHIDTLEEEIEADYQKKLVAGNNITIDPLTNRISARAEKGDKGDDGDRGLSISHVIGEVNPDGNTTVKVYLENDEIAGTFEVERGREGEPGQPGADGHDAVSPNAIVKQLSDGVEIEITDHVGTTKATVKNGKDGSDGTDGTSVTAQTTAIAGGNRVTLTDKTGAHSFDVMNGRNGEDGTDGTSVTASTSPIENGTRVTLTDKNGAHSFDVLNGTDARVSIIQERTSGEVIAKINNVDIYAPEAYDDEEIRQAINTVSGDLESAETDIANLDNQKLESYEYTFDAGSHTIKHDGETETFSSIKAKCLDRKYFVYLIYRGTLFIPQRIEASRVIFENIYTDDDDVIKSFSIQIESDETVTTVTENLQTELTAGENITIENGVISAAGGGGANLVKINMPTTPASEEEFNAVKALIDDEKIPYFLDSDGYKYTLTRIYVTSNATQYLFYSAKKYYTYAHGYSMGTYYTNFYSTDRLSRSLTSGTQIGGIDGTAIYAPTPGVKWLNTLDYSTYNTNIGSITAGSGVSRTYADGGYNNRATFVNNLVKQFNYAKSGYMIDAFTKYEFLLSDNTKVSVNKRSEHNYANSFVAPSGWTLQDTGTSSNAIQCVRFDYDLDKFHFAGKRYQAQTAQANVIIIKNTSGAAVSLSEIALTLSSKIKTIDASNYPLCQDKKIRTYVSSSATFNKSSMMTNGVDGYVHISSDNAGYFMVKDYDVTFTFNMFATSTSVPNNSYLIIQLFD